MSPLWHGWPSAALTDAAVAPMRVKLVELPHLQPGADVVDDLETHTASELHQLIADARYWYPGLDEEQRLARRRALTRRRVQRKRARDKDDLHGNAANVTETRFASSETICNAANVKGARVRSAGPPGMSSPGFMD